MVALLTVLTLFWKVRRVYCDILGRHHLYFGAVHDNTDYDACTRATGALILYRDSDISSIKGYY